MSTLTSTEDYTTVQTVDGGVTISFQGVKEKGGRVTLFNATDKDYICKTNVPFKLPRSQYHWKFELREVGLRIDPSVTSVKSGLYAGQYYTDSVA